MTTEAVAKRLIQLCREGKNLEAIQELYADDVVSVEMMGDEKMPKEMKGKEAIIGKTTWWVENHEIHSGDVSEPLCCDAHFAIKLVYEVTPKTGDMAGKRMTINELGVYTVADGKVTHEQFFYHMPIH